MPTVDELRALAALWWSVVVEWWALIGAAGLLLLGVGFGWAAIALWRSAPTGYYDPPPPDPDGDPDTLSAPLVRLAILPPDQQGPPP
jgi:hypothetical protein